MIYIVIGVSGVGKTTIGQLLSNTLNLPFFDADDFHPVSNIKKMSDGIPLNDTDRMPWLEILAEQIIEWESRGGAVLACSALKEKYRKALQSIDNHQLKFVFLNGSPNLILERLNQRSNHFMGSTLLDSQFEALERPTYGIHVTVDQFPNAIVKEIIEKMKEPSEFGMIGLGVMGKSLALNIAGKGVRLSAYNRQVEGKEVDIAKNFVQEHSTFGIQGFDDLKAFIASLQTPRNILLMVNAGKAVDMVIQDLIPLLDENDLIIDGGNSHYEATKRRSEYLEKHQIQFMGMGVSGGEEGALKGPSIMPGGTKSGYERIAKILDSIAAKDKNGQPCCAYIGPEGAGHFVKMVHNGIEYGEMQLLAEVYHLLRFHAKMSPLEIADLLEDWYKNGLSSYLLEITIDILRAKEGEAYMIDVILDKAGQKGTGGWSTNAALALGKPLNTISDAVMARCLSAMKSTRVEAASLYKRTYSSMEGLDFNQLKNAYQSAQYINHAIGFDLIQEASTEYNWNLNYAEIARIWTNGCIIRSELMEQLIAQLTDNSKHLLLHSTAVEQLSAAQSDYATIMGKALQAGCSIPVLSSAFNYFLGFTAAQSSANMIQAQRDYFGAHTFQRVDQPLGQYFHYKWKE